MKALIFLLAFAVRGQAANSAPQLPVHAVETSVAATAVTGRRIVVPTAGDIDKNGLALQHAIDDAEYGDAILVQAGAVYRIGSLMLRRKEGNGWITIETSNMNRLAPENSRISPNDASSMPKLVSPGGNSPVILTESGAHNYRLIGLEITKLDPEVIVSEMVVIAPKFDVDSSEIQDFADFPQNIIIDRCYIHGLPKNDLKRGILLHCLDCAVVNSYISDIHVVGQEGQAILFGGGPLKIFNNYLEGAGENLFGADFICLRSAKPVAPPTLTSVELDTTRDLTVGSGMAFYDGSTNLYTIVRSISGSVVTYDALASVPSANTVAYWGFLPTDVEISHNYLFKPLAWNPGDSSYAGYHPVVKNLFELKSGKRIWFHDNILENSWADGQSGYAVLFTVRNQVGKCYFCAVEDVTFERNIIKNAAFGLNLLATDNNAPSGPTHRILVRNNLWVKIRDSFQVGTLDDLIIDHNTALVGCFAGQIEDGAHRVGNAFTNNIFLGGCAGFHFNNPNAPNWDQIFPNWVLEGNIMSRVNGISAYQYMSPTVQNSNYSVRPPIASWLYRWTEATTLCRRIRGHGDSVPMAATRGRCQTSTFARDEHYSSSTFLRHTCSIRVIPKLPPPRHSKRLSQCCGSIPAAVDKLHSNTRIKLRAPPRSP